MREGQSISGKGRGVTVIYQVTPFEGTLDTSFHTVSQLVVVKSKLERERERVFSNHDNDFMQVCVPHNSCCLLPRALTRH